MSSHKESLEIAYLTVIFIGVLGNMLLLYLHSFKFITNQKKRFISPIIINLAFAHILMIIFRGIPMIIAKWGWRSFLNDTVGKILNYFIRVTRGLSLCNTCFLSVFQAITMSPSSLKWAEVKTRAQNCIPLCCILSWIFHLLVGSVVSMNVISSRNSSNERWKIGKISFDLQTISVIKILICESVLDALFEGLMICSSFYMVFILHRHKQRVQHIHSINLSHRASPEARATKVILMLVVTFVIFNSVSSPLVIYVTSAREIRHWAQPLTVTLSMFYPIVSPIILISIDTQKPRSFVMLLCLRRFFQERFSN